MEITNHRIFAVPSTFDEAYGGTVVTFDRDFRKFDGLRVLELGA